MQGQAEIRFKIIILGDWGVGKTSLLRSFVGERFYEDYLPSIGVNMLVKELQVTHAGNPIKVIFVLWDVAGHDVFKPLMPVYHQGAAGVFYVADMTRIQSFENLMQWQADLHKNVPDAIPALLLANKCDIESFLDPKFITETACQIGAFNSFQTSAKTGENVEIAFKALATRLLEKCEVPTCN